MWVDARRDHGEPRQKRPGSAGEPPVFRGLRRKGRPIPHHRPAQGEQERGEPLCKQPLKQGRAGCWSCPPTRNGNRPTHNGGAAVALRRDQGTHHHPPVPRRGRGFSRHRPRLADAHGQGFERMDRDASCIALAQPDPRDGRRRQGAPKKGRRSRCQLFYTRREKGASGTPEAGSTVRFFYSRPTAQSGDFCYILFYKKNSLLAYRLLHRGNGKQTSIQPKR